MSEQSLDDDRACVPAPGMQPVWQQAHRVAATQTEKAADPDHDPGRFEQTADLPGVGAVADQLQNPFGVPRGLTADDAVLRTKIFKSGCVVTLGAELLDSRRKAM